MGNVGTDCFTLNLDNYLGNSSVMIKFESYNAGTNGNNLFIDNININGIPNSIPPSAGFSSNTTTVCEGNYIIYNDLSSSNINSWNWSFPGGSPSTSTMQNPTITYNNNGNYDVTLIVSNANGSDTIISTNYITVNTQNDANINAVNTSCVTDQPIMLSSITTGGVWSGNGIINPNNGLFDPSIAGVGTHTITYTISGICPDSDTINIFVDDCTSISDSKEGSIELFPNPNNGEFKLIINKALNFYEDKINIINQLGEIVYYEEINQSNNTYIKHLNLTSLTDGIYYLKFSSSVIKFIKQ